MAVNEDVESVSYLIPLHWAFHGYVYPFIVLYAIECLLWYLWLTSEGAFILISLTVVFQCILALFCIWSVHIKALLAYKKVDDVRNAVMVKVVPTSNNGSVEIVALHCLNLDSGSSYTWFDFQKSRYFYDYSLEKFASVKYPEDWKFDDYLKHKGLETDQDIASGKQKYSLNIIDVELPDFITLFIEKATAPFFVFQVFCVVLWCLEEYWYYSIFTLLMLILFEAILVKQQQRNQLLIKNMSPKPYTIYVYRNKKWYKLLTDSLLPGDIVSLVRYDEGYSVPCDILLLHGQCIVDEALLTGESVPQMKEPISSVPCDRALSLETDTRLHVISGGTKLAQHISSSDLPSALKAAPDNGCIGFVLKTGFSTSQGRLLRTILYSVKRVTANNLESFLFIAFLLIFAIAASTYVWIRGAEDPNQTTYKLLLECVLIITSVVPPELPVELSLAVNSSLSRLVKADIYCTEPFRIPFAGKINVCCFDKTGTLTSDSFVVHGVAGVNRADPAEMTTVDDLSLKTLLVLASCHSLVLVDGTLAGDPIEVASLNAINWKLTRNDFLCSQKDKKLSLKIVRRFHFTSALKRMCVVCTQHSGGADSKNVTYISTMKGAAEVLHTMFNNPPAFYEEVYKALSASGYRVLALGYKYLGPMTSNQVRSLQRQELEHNFEFAGFVVTSNPINKGSSKCIRSILSSSHLAVMITGDNPLTACHVAQELKISQKKVLMLTSVDRDWFWQDVKGTTTIPFSHSTEAIKTVYELHDICLTGESLDFLFKHHKPVLYFLLPQVKVFARVTPKQKQQVITSYRDEGMYTLMCGDGTNDVGALKHAHVGVSLLKHTKHTSVKPTSSMQVSSSNPSKLDSLHRRPLHRLRNKDGNVLASEKRDQKDQKMLMKNQLYESQEGPVKLGDASIASPFTYKGAGVGCVLQILKQGRCTLVTTLQMLKILALNALILAYSQSVLYVHGIKFSDTQYTLQGVLLAACFLFVSQSKPVDDLSKERPLPNFFNIYTVTTVLMQFGIHFMALVRIVQETQVLESSPKGVDLEKEFEENTVNSAVFLLCLTMQITNFIVNYHGKPFMSSLHENKPLFCSLLGPLLVVVMLTFNIYPDFNRSLEIVEFSDEFQRSMFAVMVIDFALSFLCDRILQISVKRLVK